VSLLPLPDSGDSAQEPRPEQSGAVGLQHITHDGGVVRSLAVGSGRKTLRVLVCEAQTTGK
jgi:hypothetical protein